MEKKHPEGRENVRDSNSIFLYTHARRSEFPVYRIYDARSENLSSDLTILSHNSWQKKQIIVENYPKAFSSIGRCVTISATAR